RDPAPFPTRRSSDLANGALYWAHRLAGGWTRAPITPGSVVTGRTAVARVPAGLAIAYLDAATGVLHYAEQDAAGNWMIENVTQLDRKSTRLNSSHRT